MKLKLLSLFIILVCWAMSPLYGQIYQHFTKNNGLSGNGVYRVTQDRQGFIWLTSPNGISRFDGSSFKHFNARNGLPQNDIWYLLPDLEDRMWYFTKAKALGYIKNNQVFSFLNQENSPFYPQNLYQTDSLIAFYSRNPLNAKYFVFSDGVWKSNPSEKNVQRYADIVRKYSYKYQNHNTVVSDSTGKPLLLIPIITPSAQNEKRQINDSLFIDINESQILYLNTKSLTYGIHKLPQPIKTGRITLFENHIQISTEDQLYLFDINFKLLSIFKAPLKDINSIFHFLDRNENLWVSTLNDGLFFFPKMNQDLQTFFLDKRIKDLLVFNDQLYVHTAQNGYFRLSPDNQFIEKIMDFGNVGQMNLTHQGKGLAITNTHELYTQLPGETEGKLNIKLQQGLTVLSHHQGKWFNAGLMNLQLSEDFKRIESIISYDASQHLLATKNRLFSGGVDGLKTWQNRSVTAFVTQDSLHLRTITQLKLLNNTQILIGTESNGLYLVNKTASRQLLDTGGESVKHLFVEDENHIWVVTHSCMMRLQSANFWTSGATAEDAFCDPFLLLQSELNAVAVWNKTIYLGTNKGLISLPIDDLFNLPQPEFYLKSISFNQGDFTQNSQYLYQPTTLLNIELGTLQLLPVQSHSYQYRLLPLQKKWIALEGNGITLTGFEPDKYTVELRQVGLETHVLRFPFEILPQWWQHVLFKVFLILLAVALTAFIAIGILKHRFKIKEKRLEQLKTQTEHELHALRSQMNPHFIFNSLNAIQYYLNEKGAERSEKYLIDFSKLIRMIFEYSRQRTVTLSQEIQLLESYLSLEKMRFGDKLSFSIYADAELDVNRWKIPSLLLQTLVENAVNHGIFHSLKPGFIEIKFIKQNAQTLEVIIEDNGVGIKKTQLIYQNAVNKNPSKSTDILSNRIKLLNQMGEFLIHLETKDLESENQSGTSVCLSIHQSLNKITL